MIMVPAFSRRYKLSCAQIKDSDQPSLIRFVDGCSMSSKGSKVFSDVKLRLLSDFLNAKTDLNLHSGHSLNYFQPCADPEGEKGGLDPPTRKITKKYRVF